jgi:cobalt-zinc-cadmium efflux system membrane fusion protein
VAATVDAESRSVSLIAELTNDDAHYKPGMFVWVELPQGELRDVLSVPAESVMRHEGKAFVFVPDGDDRFRRVDIEPGIEGDGFVEVKRGLETGQRVVSKGAFLLKSELLLEDEG